MSGDEIGQIVNTKPVTNYSFDVEFPLGCTEIDKSLILGGAMLTVLQEKQQQNRS